MNSQKKTNLAIAMSAASLVGTVIMGVALHNQTNKAEELRELVSTVSASVDSLGNQSITSSTTPVNDDSIKAFVMNNPETILQSLAKYRFEQEQLQAQREAESIKTYKGALENDKSDPFIGNPNGKHVVVEFMDYNCGYCKKLAPTLKAFVEQDPEAKVVIKEFPIFDNIPSSRHAAVMGVAVGLIDHKAYEKYHDAIIGYAQGAVSNEFIDKTVADLGITAEQLKGVINQAQEKVNLNRTLGAQLGVSGTPTVFINDQKFNGLTVEQIHNLFK